jgi:hypothetical protein
MDAEYPNPKHTHGKNSQKKGISEKLAQHLCIVIIGK